MSVQFQKDLMVVSDLQHALITEIKHILSDLVNTGNGTTYAGFNGYAQFLPVLKNDDDDPDQFFPYFIVRVNGGKTVDDNDLWTVDVTILLGVQDEDTDNLGQFHVMNAIDRITTRFCQEATLGTPGHKAFRCLPEMEWALQDEDTYPYYFGAVQLKFMVPKPGRRTIPYAF